MKSTLPRSPASGAAELGRWEFPHPAPPRTRWLHTRRRAAYARLQSLLHVGSQLTFDAFRGLPASPAIALHMNEDMAFDGGGAASPTLATSSADVERLVPQDEAEARGANGDPTMTAT